MIEIRDCTKKYGELVAVDNLNLQNISIAEELPWFSEQIIKISGYDMSRDPVSAKQVLAYVPEKGYVFEKLTAWEYLTFIAGLYHIDEDPFQKNALEYLKVFGLYEWKDEIIGNFSMGMKQRLLLTSAFMRNPKVIILDEPHNGLDPKGVRLLKDVLFKIRNEGATIVLSTHIIAIAEQICDRIAIINKGSVIAQGTNEDLRNYAQAADKTLEDIFLRLTSNYVIPGAGG